MRFVIDRLAPLALLVVAVGGCGPGEKKGPPVNTEEVKQSVGPEGGTVTHPSGAAVTIPAGALASPVEISVRGIEAPTGAPGTAVTQGFLLGPEGTQFLAPVDVAVPFDPLRVSGEGADARLRVFIAPQGSSDFTELETRVDSAKRLLIAKTTHFSQVVGCLAHVDQNVLRITTPSPLPEATAGVAYGPLTLTASGGMPPYKWRTTSAPFGLSLSEDGELAGTPNAPGGFLLTVQVTDSTQETASRSLEIPMSGGAAAPVITSISPSTVRVGASSTTVWVTGSGFYSNANIVVNESKIYPHSWLSGTSMSVTLPGTLLAEAGVHTLQVRNPTSLATRTSNLVEFTVENHGAQLSSIEPPSAEASGTDVSITLTGSHFAPGALVYAQSQAVETTFVSTTELQAVLPGELLSAPGSLVIEVRNPEPGGGSDRRPLSFTVLPVDDGTPIGCTSSEALLLAGGQQYPGPVAVDDYYVYWGTGSQGVHRVRKDGTNKHSLVIDSSLPQSNRVEQPVAVDDTHVFVGRDSGVYRVPKAGGSAELVARTSSVYNSGYVRALALDSTHVYWVDWDFNSVYRARKDADDGAFETIASFSSFGSDRSHQKPARIALDETHVYWAAEDGGVFRVRKDGSDQLKIGAGGKMTGLGVDESHVFWAEEYGRVVRAEKDGSNPVELSPTNMQGGAPRPGGLALGSDLVFFTTGSSAYITVGKDGTDLQFHHFGGTGSSRYILLDESAVYWVSSGGFDGRIHRACR